MRALTHQQIDARLLRLTEAVVQRLDAEPALRARLAETVSRWKNARLRKAWQLRLAWPWPVLRACLLAPTEDGAALRQDAPLAGILPETERARIMAEFADNSSAT